MNRIVIVGSSGAGKTSLAKILARKFGMPHIELDALNWLPNWKARVPEEFHQLVAKNIKQPAWVLCGNYSNLRKMIWARADTIIWLDYPFWLCFWQTLTRSLRHIFDHKPFCNGNYESFDRLFFSKKSILWWMMTQFRKKRKRYLRLMSDPTCPHLIFIRLRNRQETKYWLESLL